FRSVIEVDVLLNNLQDIWLGGYKLKVNVSRFGRDSHKPISHKPSPDPSFHPQVGKATLNDRSFAEAVGSKADSPSSSQKLPPPPSRFVEINV
ncbi:hypothetical protein A2U01_0078145, partial [Trifolium medium]|nr:hypothetical protein [Trifolium medium]